MPAQTKLRKVKILCHAQAIDKPRSQTMPLCNYMRLSLVSTVTALLLLTSSAGLGESVVDKQGYIDSRHVQQTFCNALAAAYEEDRIPVAISTLRARVHEEHRFDFEPLCAHGPQLSAAELYQQKVQSVVQVSKLYTCDNCDEWHTTTAAGFVIGKDGIIVTSAHVLSLDEDGEALAVRTYNDRMLLITDVLASDKQSDLMVLRVNANDLVPLPIAEDIEVGEDIVVISHPDDSVYVMTAGIVAAKTTHKHHGKPQRALAITADYARGSSGGPVLNRQGAVVGIVRTTTPVYYETNNGTHEALQMVWKHCAPSIDLFKILRADTSAQPSLNRRIK